MSLNGILLEASFNFQVLTLKPEVPLLFCDVLHKKFTLIFVQCHFLSKGIIYDCVQTVTWIFSSLQALSMS